MSRETTISILNRLWVIHNYSLATYLSYAPPWWHEGDGPVMQLLRDVASDQQQLADRLGKLIVHYGGQVVQGKYPNRFTTLHDLSSQYLLQELVQYQQRTVTAIESLIPQLPPGSASQALAQECLGAAKAHLDSMHEIARQAQPLSA